MINLTYKGLKNDTYTLGASVGKGGEGTIYYINDKLVAKIYRDDVLATRGNELQKKIELMSKIELDPNVLQYLSWPIDPLYENGSFCGYTARNLSGYREIHRSYNENERIPLMARVVIAQNLCIIVKVIHSAGLIIGDFNPFNIGFNERCNVALYDLDSCHVVNKAYGIDFRCPVGTENYTAPEVFRELDAIKLKSSTGTAFYGDMEDGFNQDTDNFALGIHIFNLIMDGFQPYSSKKVGTGSYGSNYLRPPTGSSSVAVYNPKNEIIMDAYCFKSGYEPKCLQTPAVDTFSFDLRLLFAETFRTINGDHRPTAEMWYNALKDFEKELIDCSKNNVHQYMNSLSKCPYCKANDKYNKANSPIAPLPNNPTQTVTSQTTSPTTSKSTYAPPKNKKYKSSPLKLSMPIFIAGILVTLWVINISITTGDELSSTIIGGVVPLIVIIILFAGSSISSSSKYILGYALFVAIGAAFYWLGQSYIESEYQQTYFICSIVLAIIAIVAFIEFVREEL